MARTAIARSLRKRRTCSWKWREVSILSRGSRREGAPSAACPASDREGLASGTPPSPGEVGGSGGDGELKGSGRLRGGSAAAVLQEKDTAMGAGLPIARGEATRRGEPPPAGLQLDVRFGEPNSVVLGGHVWLPRVHAYSQLKHQEHCSPPTLGSHTQHLRTRLRVCVAFRIDDAAVLGRCRRGRRRRDRDVYRG